MVNGEREILRNELIKKKLKRTTIIAQKSDFEHHKMIQYVVFNLIRSDKIDMNIAHSLSHYLILLLPFLSL